MGKIILVTGASSGFGRLTAEALAKAGHTVYASMRETTGWNAPEVAKMAAFSQAHGVDLRTVELHVLSKDSVDVAVAKVIVDTGHIDVLVHNAGHMAFGPAEAITPEQLAQLYDVNVLSTQRVNRAVLPHLRRQKLWERDRGCFGGPVGVLHGREPRGVSAVGGSCQRVVRTGNRRLEFSPGGEITRHGDDAGRGSRHVEPLRRWLR